MSSKEETMSDVNARIDELKTYVQEHELPYSFDIYEISRRITLSTIVVSETTTTDAVDRANKLSDEMHENGHSGAMYRLNHLIAMLNEVRVAEDEEAEGDAQ